jgi:uncharacterized Zn finger protein
VNSVAVLVAPDKLKDLATPSDFKLGSQIHANHTVEIEHLSPQRVVAHATGGQRRLVELRATDSGLTYTCTCSSKLAKPCKHVVAVGLATWDKSPKHRA